MMDNAMPFRRQIDAGPLAGLQLLVIGVCFFLNMLDGMDVLAISFAAPVIAGDWAVTPQTLGIVFSAALVGMTLGAVFISPYTDVIGRRNMILASLSVISLGTFGTAFVQSVTQLMLLRLVAGLGIGSMLASLTSLVSEFSPDRHRNLFILLLHSGYAIGAIITGFVAAWILPDYGWRPLFILAGAVSIIALPLVFTLLPESPEFLAKRQPRNALPKINRILARMAQDPIDSLPEKLETRSSVGRIRALLSGELKAPTLTLWLAFMMGFATLYFLFSWVVKLAVQSGLDIEKAMYAGIALNTGAFLGSVSLGYLSAKLGLKRVIFLFFLLGAVFIVAYGNLKVSVAMALALVFALMYFVHGAFTGLYAVAARLYPTEMRTTGVGWAIGAGRVGAIGGPAAAGFILGAGVSIGWTFVIFAVPALLAGFTIARLASEKID